MGRYVSWHPDYDPYFSELTEVRDLDLEDRMIHYWGVKADDMTPIRSMTDGQRLVAVNLDVNLIVVTSYTETGDPPTDDEDGTERP